jgi:hypothetical protein
MKTRRLPAIAAVLLANASLIASAPPAYAHCDDPHGAVEVLVCRAQCHIDRPDPWKCPRGLAIDS